MISFVNLTGQREKYRLELEKAEREVLDSGCFVGGPQVRSLEEELSGYLERHGQRGKTLSLTCGSGTDALTLALMAIGMRPGDEVIVPDFTFIAPAECVAFLGGTPVFADIDRNTLQVSPESVQALIGPRTRGIIAVNLFGQCAPLRELRKIADEHGFWIIEDSAQAFGATTGDSAACTLGDISITSFYPSKPLGCYGDGGALFTADESLYQKARTFANHGSVGRYDHQSIGINSRLDALQAAVLRVKLRHLDDELTVRRRNAQAYDEFFERYNRTATAGQKIYPQKTAPGNASTYAQYTVLAEDRDRFIARLEQAGIPHCIHYPAPLHSQGCFAGSQVADPASEISRNPNAEWASAHVLSLPVCAFTDVDEIVARIATADIP